MMKSKSYDSFYSQFRLSSRFIIATLVLISVVFSYVGYQLFISTKSFDHEIWRKADAQQRGKMVRELQSSEILIGLTRDEVLNLLGPSENSLRMEQSVLIYAVDVGTRFGSDPWKYTFVIQFDPKSGRVVGTELQD
jgi:hypothetical protein